jgi:hypothetical protein
MTGSIPNPENYITCFLPTWQIPTNIKIEEVLRAIFTGRNSRQLPLSHVVRCQCKCSYLHHILRCTASLPRSVLFQQLLQQVASPHPVSCVLASFFLSASVNSFLTTSVALPGTWRQALYRSACCAMLASATSPHRHCGATVIITSDRLVQSVLATRRATRILHQNN